jgi:hypothetical protein
MKTNRTLIRAFFFGTVCLITFLLVGCASQRRQKYQNIVGLVEEIGLLNETQESILFQCIDRKHGAALPGAVFEVRSREGLITLTSDDRGKLEFPIRETLRRENPWVYSRNRCRLELSLNLSGRIIGRSDGGKLRRVIERERTLKEGKESLYREGFSVWFDAVLKSEAQELATIAEQQRALIQEMTGLEPIPWSIVLVDRLEEGTAYIVLYDDPDVETWLYAVTELRTGKFARANTHEWTELTMKVRADVTKDRRNRFISDGLAELASYRFTESPPGIERVQSLLREGIRYVDLLADFQMVSSSSPKDVVALATDTSDDWGYPLSFIFWQTLCEEHGVDIPARFLATVQASDARDTDSLLRILAEIAGKPDIAARLRHFSVDEALKSLERLPRSTSPTENQE